MHPALAIEDLRAFLPAKDLATSKNFYRALGFEHVWASDTLVLFQLGRLSFFVQDYFVKEWAENMMLELRVANADAYFLHLQNLELTERFPTTVRIGAPEDDLAKGIRRGHFVDPSGVLWHFCQTIG
jgi:catechol 2,3-dioxygenase-like lactoylglutathione lyase family enzyme